MTERVIFKKYHNLSEDELGEKSNKNIYVKNDIVTTVIKRCRDEKRGKRKIGGFRKKLMILDLEIIEFPEREVKPNIENILVNEYLTNILLRIMKLILIFIGIKKKKYKLIKISVNIYYLELMFILLNVS